jgi:hypothetical protein
MSSQSKYADFIPTTSPCRPSASLRIYPTGPRVEPPQQPAITVRCALPSSRSRRASSPSVSPQGDDEPPRVRPLSVRPRTLWTTRPMPSRGVAEAIHRCARHDADIGVFPAAGQPPFRSAAAAPASRGPAGGLPSSRSSRRRGWSREPRSLPGSSRVPIPSRPASRS